MRLRPFLSVSLGALLALAGCDTVRDASDHAADSSKQVIHDTKERWSDLFTYHPRSAAVRQYPQTRYCYRMQSDIVCYDSPQVAMTAPLVGFQDGDQISWYQQGGGSNGFSAPGNVNHEGSASKSVAVVTGVAPSPQSGEITVTNTPSPFKKQVK